MDLGESGLLQVVNFGVASLFPIVGQKRLEIFQKSDLNPSRSKGYSDSPQIGQNCKKLQFYSVLSQILLRIVSISNPLTEYFLYTNSSQCSFSRTLIGSVITTLKILLTHSHSELEAIRTPLLITVRGKVTPQ